MYWRSRFLRPHLHYKEGLDKANYTETIRQIIPVEGPKDGKEYAVMVGFQPEDNDLYFNRAKARLAPCAGGENG